MSKNIKQTKKKDLVNKIITVFGGVELDRDEKSFLVFGPDYSMFDNLDMEEIEKEMLTTTTKIRWARMNKENDEIKYERDSDELDKDEEAEKLVYLNKRVFKEELGKVDMGYRRSTNMKTSRRVIFPPGRPVKKKQKYRQDWRYGER